MPCFDTGVTEIKKNTIGIRTFHRTASLCGHLSIGIIPVVTYENMETQKDQILGGGNRGG